MVLKASSLTTRRLLRVELTIDIPKDRIKCLYLSSTRYSRVEMFNMRHLNSHPNTSLKRIVTTFSKMSGILITVLIECIMFKRLAFNPGSDPVFTWEDDPEKPWNCCCCCHWFLPHPTVACYCWLVTSRKYHCTHSWIRIFPHEGLRWHWWPRDPLRTNSKETVPSWRHRH